MKHAIWIAALLLAGCQSKPLDQLSYSELKDLAKVIGERCEAQGITRTSPEWSACVRQETNKEDAKRESAAARRRSSDYCVTNNAGGTLMTNCI